MESLKDKLDFVIEVVSRVSTNCQVIHVDNKPSVADIVGKVKIHECLECWGRSTKPEKHYCWFEQPKRHDECSLPFISFLDLNIVVTPSYIKLGEERELSEVVDEVGDKG